MSPAPAKRKRNGRRGPRRKRPFVRRPGGRRAVAYINTNRFFAARVVLGVTLADVAEAMDLSEWSLVKYVGRKEWPVEHFETLEDLLDMPASWFKNPKPPRFVVEREG